MAFPAVKTVLGTARCGRYPAFFRPSSPCLSSKSRRFDLYEQFAKAASRQQDVQQGMRPNFSMPPPPPPPFTASSPFGTRSRPLFVQLSERPTSRGTMIFHAALWAGFWYWLLTYLQEPDQVDGDAKRKRPSGSLMSLLGQADIDYRPVDVTDVSFSHVLGCDEAKQELQEIVEFLRDRKRFESLGGRLPKGLLLVGRPGTGKTMLAKAIAHEAGVPFFYVSGSEFDEVFVGLGAKRIRELFRAAKKAGPALVFIDEIDAIGMTRRNVESGQTSRQTLNQLLSEMDGFTPSTNVIVIAATNVDKGLDSALTRPGRFDRTVHVNAPDMKGRTDILRHYITKIKSVAPSHPLHLEPAVIAKNTVGLVGADLANIINIAALHAAEVRKKAVDRDDVEYAIDRVAMGLEHRTLLGEKEKLLTAVHEGGHTLCAMLTPSADPVHKVTIVGRGSALGFTKFASENDQVSSTIDQMRARLIVAMGGYVAEELVFGPTGRTTGASNDLAKAADMARDMVTRYGFGPNTGVVGVIGEADSSSYAGPLGSRADSTRHTVDQDAQQFLSDAYAAARALLTKHRPELDLITKALVDRETLSAGQLKHLLKTRSMASLESVT
eukprot:TRINITY_DN55696_c0_g1_i1.p1 TRINITY_DN55696_c0_g1~~TRINITY_DN55696_c0_g1_i1.p1  ORF type:complete len:647 (-),score=87.45 TRINITY_DN55696_c0_g1_i1:1123-2949(-)